MPGSGDYNSKKIIAAVQDGRLSPETLDQSVPEVLAVILKAKDSHKETPLLTSTSITPWHGRLLGARASCS